MSRFYGTSPADPDGPRELTEYRGPRHGLLRPGFRVAYENPAWLQPDGSYRTGGLDGPLTVTELIDLGGDGVPWLESGRVQAVLNDGEYEVSADNLRWLDACDRCREKPASRSTSEICTTCNPVRVCPGCFVLHAREVADERAQDRIARDIAGGTS
jgi:hypothetical protein